ncbi:hypothetical protein [Pseudotenacibaculum haliotis]|uniref:Homing endonuclease LAGLIDADG domain-containing protein n=1 Tax=Pseudotenacibaculum haliotis TaxID=1862138 RepID=A0ABW5LS27_9FLAO
MRPPHIKAQREKEILRIEKRQRELYKQLFELGYEKLENPIRHGWYRELIITKDVWTYKNAEEILEVYQKIVPMYWGATKEKARRVWDKKCSLFMISRDKPTISKKQYNKLSDKAKKYCVVFKYKTLHGNSKTRFYVNFPKACSRFQFKRAYITHRKRIDPEMISELTLLDQKLLRDGYYKLNMGGYWNRWNRIDKAIEIKKETRKVKQKLKSFKGKISNKEKEKLWEVN